MKSFENILAPEQSLEGQATDSRDQLDDYIDKVRTEHGDIIDPDGEMQHNIQDLGRFSRIMGSVLSRDSSDISETSSANDAVYRSICFAVQITEQLLPDSFDCELVAYSRERIASDDSLDGLVEDSQDYLQRRSELDALLGYYMPEIDRSGRYDHAVELFAATVFMLSERSAGQQYAAACFENMTVEDFQAES